MSVNAWIIEGTEAKAQNLIDRYNQLKLERKMRENLEYQIISGTNPEKVFQEIKRKTSSGEYILLEIALTPGGFEGVEIARQIERKKLSRWVLAHTEADSKIAMPLLTPYQIQHFPSKGSDELFECVEGNCRCWHWIDFHRKEPIKPIHLEFFVQIAGWTEPHRVILEYRKISLVIASVHDCLSQHLLFEHLRRHNSEKLECLTLHGEVYAVANLRNPVWSEYAACLELGEWFHLDMQPITH